MSQDRIDEAFEPEIQQKEKLKRMAERRSRDAWTSLMATRFGRRVIYDLLGISHFGLSAFAGDSNTTLFVSGKQKVGEFIMENLNAAAPESYYQMLKEAKEDLDHDIAEQ